MSKQNDFHRSLRHQIGRILFIALAVLLLSAAIQPPPPARAGEATADGLGHGWLVASLRWQGGSTAVPAGLSAADWQAIQDLVPTTYLKASNTGAGDWFGDVMAVDGDTVVVGARYEDSTATGVNGDQADNSALDSGAVYVFTRTGGVWSQQAYLKASNTGARDQFGNAVAIDGDTVVVGAYWEESSATGVNGDQGNNSATKSGAAYVFTRTGGVWSQQAYLKASNTGVDDWFGHAVAVEGDTVVVGAVWEASSATGIDGDQADNSAPKSGAAYVFNHTGGVWSQQAYLKASNTGADDQFGASVAVDGDTVVVGALYEDSNATGSDGDQADNSAPDSGAAYIFTRTGGVWSQQVYLKASNTGLDDVFGNAVAIDGDTMVVGARGEASNATGVNGDQADNSAANSGAAYLFTRTAGVWSQQAYLKASNTGAGDLFGRTVAIDGDTMVVAAPVEDSNATGVDGDQADNSAPDSGAAYIYEAVTVEAADDFPYQVEQNGFLAVPQGIGLLANDTASLPITATLTQEPITGTLVLLPNGSFTYKPALNYTGTITFTYNAQATLGNATVSDEATAYIFVGDVQGPVNITLSADEIRENLVTGTPIGDLQTIDATPGTSHTYTLVAGSDDNDQFAIVGNQLVSNAIFDYEAGQSPLRRVRIRTYNGQLALEKSFVVRILDEVGEPDGPPEQCNGNDITFYDSSDGEHAAVFSNLTVTNFTQLGCDLTGTLTIRFQGQTVHTQTFSTSVNRWNKLLINNAKLNNFTVNVAGIDVRAEEIRLTEYSGSLAVRLYQTDVCAPVEWGGDCVEGAPANMRLDGSGLFTGTGTGLPMPDFTIDQAQGFDQQIAAQSPMSSFTSLLKLSAKKTGLKNLPTARITKVDGGYEISAALALGLPKVPIEKGCAIWVAITLFKSNDGVVTMTIAPLDPALAPEGLEFREGTLGLECDTGIPIGTTGLQISGISGTVSLRPDMQFVKIAVKITTIKGGDKLFALTVGATLFWEPEWGFDLTGEAKVFKVLDVGGFKASVRSDQMSFEGYVQSVVLKGEVRFYAWWPDGKFHFSGSGRMQLGVEKGALFSKCVDTFLFGERCVSIPPTDMRVGGVGVEGGEFTNGRYGFKGYVEIIRKQYGFFVSEDGFDVGGVNSYTIATPPDIELARQQWQEQRGMVEAGLLAWDSPFSFPNDNTLALEVRIDPSDVISQVTVLNPSDTLFIVSSGLPLTVTLETPSGDIITPQNAAAYSATYTVTDLITYTQHLYTVDSAAIGDWQVIMEGDTTTQAPLLAVVGLANIPTLQDVELGDASDPSQIDVNWTFNSDTPVTVTIYANAGEITSTITVTDLNDIPSVEVIENFSGIPVAEVVVNNTTQLRGLLLNTGTVDLTTLESGNFALWIAVNNGIHPEINSYVKVPDTSEVARVAVDNTAALPATWTAVFSATVDPSTNQVVVIAPALSNGDVDSYGINIGQSPNSPELAELGGFAQYERDENGDPIGAAYVRQTVNSVRPGETYYISFSAFDEDSGWSVTSQEIMVTISAGEYTLNTAASRYAMAAGESITVPVSLNITEPLFYPNVYMELNTSDLPRGLTVLFENDALGTTNLSEDVPSVNLIITAEPTTPDGLYPFEVFGTNGNNSFTRTLTIQVGQAEIFLPLVFNGMATPAPVSLSGAIAPRPATQSGEVFFTTSVSLPALHPTGSYQLSASPTTAVPVVVDDEIALLLNGQELFVHNFVGANGIEPAVVPIPRTIMAQLAGQTVNIVLRDVQGGNIGASSIYLRWVP
ncbi:MAG: Ig-like domain-containing protein [Chloroflexi bacterium]|nr:Ig-like domain-containing protein [Chloroflexota bacterium]